MRQSLLPRIDEISNHTTSLLESSFLLHAVLGKAMLKFIAYYVNKAGLAIKNPPKKNPKKPA
jgi:hypothetical protein